MVLAPSPSGVPVLLGLPGLEGSRPGRRSEAWAPLLSDWDWSVDDADDARVRLAGIDVTRDGDQQGPTDLGHSWPETGFFLSGQALGEIGVQLPALPPEHARVLHATVAS